MSLQDLEDALESADKSTIFRNLNLFRTHKLIHDRRWQRQPQILGMQRQLPLRAR